MEYRSSKHCPHPKVAYQPQPCSACYQEEIDELCAQLASKDKEIEHLRKDSQLSNELCVLLMDHVGETGQSEGAVDVLKRKLDELKALRAENERLKRCPTLDQALNEGDGSYRP